MEFFIMLSQEKQIYTIIATERQLKIFMIYFKRYVKNDESFYKSYFDSACDLLRRGKRVGLCYFCVANASSFIGTTFTRYFINELYASNSHNIFLTFKERRLYDDK